MRIQGIDNLSYGARIQFANSTSAQRTSYPTIRDYCTQICSRPLVCVKKICLLSACVIPVISKIIKVRNSVKFPS